MLRRRTIGWFVVGFAFFLGSSLSGCMCIYILPGGQFPEDGKHPDGGQARDAIQKERPPEEVVAQEEAIPEEPIPEGPICIDGERRPCQTKELGVCKDGEEVCELGRWKACRRLVSPSAEQCDGLDNDCNGKIDENLVRKCPYTGPAGTEGKGPCKAGTQVCADGRWGVCTGEVLPKPEVCDGLDNDCDGAIDEWLPIQQIGSVHDYSSSGDPSHLYMVTTTQGYAFAWSETGTQRLLVTRVQSDGSRMGADWVVTKGQEYGNVHGLAWTGKAYAVSWDTDKGGTGGDAYVALMDDQTGQRIAGPQLLAKGGRMVNPQVSSGPGFFGVVWSDYQTLRLYVQTLNMDLTPRAAPLSFPISTNMSPYPGSAFSQDRLAAVWIDRSNKIQVAIIDPQTQQIGNTETITYPGSSPADPNITGDATGYLVVWSDRGDGKLWGLRLDRNGAPTGAPNQFAAGGAETPILKATSFGGVVAWVQTQDVGTQQGRRGISIGRIDRNGKMLTLPSWFSVPAVEPYLTLGWTDLGQGMGRGAVAWIENKRYIKLAPLGCR